MSDLKAFRDGYQAAHEEIAARLLNAKGLIHALTDILHGHPAFDTGDDGAGAVFAVVHSLGEQIEAAQAQQDAAWKAAAGDGQEKSPT